MNGAILGHSSPNKTTRPINIDNNEYRIELEPIKEENSFEKIIKIG